MPEDMNNHINTVRALMLEQLRALRTAPAGTELAEELKRSKGVSELSQTIINSVTVSKGASNGYTGFGASFSMEIKGGGEVTIYCAGNGVAVAAGVRTLDLSGTGTDSFSFAVGAGT